MCILGEFDFLKILMSVSNSLKLVYFQKIWLFKDTDNCILNMIWLLKNADIYVSNLPKVMHREKLDYLKNRWRVSNHLLEVYYILGESNSSKILLMCVWSSKHSAYWEDLIFKKYTRWMCVELFKSSKF